MTDNNPWRGYLKNGEVVPPEYGRQARDAAERQKASQGAALGGEGTPVYGSKAPVRDSYESAVARVNGQLAALDLSLIHI